MDLFNFGLTKTVIFFLVLARVGGIFSAAPVFGNKNVPPMVRVIIALSLTFIFLPVAKFEFDASKLDILNFTVLIAKEAMVGLIIGFVASLTFTAIQMAGSFIDLSSGLGFASMIDPMLKENHAVIGQFYNMVATLLFLSINAHYVIINGLADSFSVLPLGKMAISPELTGGMFQVFSIIFLAAMKIGAPIIGVVFLTDISLGVLARTVPQLNVFVVGLPAKLGVSLMTIIIVLPVSMGIMTKLFFGLQKDFILIFKAFAG